MAGVDEQEEESTGDEPLDRRDTDPSSGSVAPRPRSTTKPGRKKPYRPADDEQVGRTFGGKYRIDKLIAKGGMGRVYRATQFPLERPVAIKVLNREFQQSDPQFVKRFFLEASIAAQLSHPHTITVFDYGESDTGDLYIAMEYLKGRPLSKILRTDGPFSAEETLRLSIQICRALRAAHEKGIIHRDLKPGNIFVLEEQAEDGGGYAKVLDFGLVKLFTPESDKGNAIAPNLLGEGEGELTRTGTLLGSPKYMSPEQIQGLQLDPRTDIYSFGIILYQMVSGKAPFTGATGVDVIYKHVNFPVPPIATQTPEADCPPDLEDIIQKCLAKRRDDRFPSMDALLERLKDAQRSISGISVAGESLSHSSDVSSSARRLQLREASLNEPLPEDPTPLGSLTQQDSAPAPRPNRLPLVIAAVGFLVALTTMILVLSSGTQVRETKPVIQHATPAIDAPKVEAPTMETKVDPPAREPVVEEGEEPIKKADKKKKKKRDKKEDDDVALPPNYRENPY
jgi:serine/threonine-protein kinase